MKNEVRSMLSRVKLRFERLRSEREALDKALQQVAQEQVKPAPLLCTKCHNRGYSKVYAGTTDPVVLICTACPAGEALGELLDEREHETSLRLLRSLRRALHHVPEAKKELDKRLEEVK